MWGAENINKRLNILGWSWGVEKETKMKMLFSLPGQTGLDMIGRVMEILIGAVGLKEFVPGTGFLIHQL